MALICEAKKKKKREKRLENWAIYYIYLPCSIFIIFRRILYSFSLRLLMRPLGCVWRLFSFFENKKMVLF